MFVGESGTLRDKPKGCLHRRLDAIPPECGSKFLRQRLIVTKSNQVKLLSSKEPLLILAKILIMLSSINKLHSFFL